VTYEQLELLRDVPMPHPLYMPEPIDEAILKISCLIVLLSCVLPDLLSDHADFETPELEGGTACASRQNPFESTDISTPPALVEEITTVEDVPEH
jgi:hypothetical protein